ncbi:MAG TPA: ATP-binding protein [Thermoanaerobaculia bacterium]|nr:ATP-binding protein [Thermoanaerobaculia bacterium]
MILSDILQDQNPWWRNRAIRRAWLFPVRRELQPKVLSQIVRFDDRRAVVLLGPRQVGKTVLLLQLADDLLEAGWPPQSLTYFDFSDDRLTERVTARDVAEIQPVGLDPAHRRVLLFDEIRQAPRWDRWLKQAVDHGRDRIVATDSAASLLRDGSQESGQGRWDEIVLEGLTFREFVRLYAGLEEGPGEALLDTPDLLDRYLTLGGFPEHARSEDFSEAHRRLRHDIVERALLRDLAGLGVDVQRIKDLFVYLIRDSGGEFNAEARGRDLDADRRSVQEWVRLLSDTLLIVSLERFVEYAAAGLRSRPKIYAADPGILQAFSVLPFGDAAVRARSFESAVFRHLREVSRETSGEVGYFRHRDDLEIDFVLHHGGHRIGVEVTSSPRVRSDKLERLKKAGRALEADRLFLIYGGLVEESFEGGRALPLARFLLDPGTALEEP